MKRELRYDLFSREERLKILEFFRSHGFNLDVAIFDHDTIWETNIDNDYYRLNKYVKEYVSNSIEIYFYIKDAERYEMPEAPFVVLEVEIIQENSEHTRPIFLHSNTIKFANLTSSIEYLEAVSEYAFSFVEWIDGIEL